MYLPELSGEEVQPWTLERVIQRFPIEGTLKASRGQSKRWMATWMFLSLMVTLVLASVDAPLVAYATPVLTLLLAANTGTRRKAPTRTG